MRSIRTGQATAAATRRDWHRPDPRAYIRIAAALRERITAGELAPGQATPSIIRLSADHGVARQTAAHALHVLQGAGLVYRVPRARLPRLQRHPLPAALFRFPGRAEDRAAEGGARVGGASLPCLAVGQLGNRGSWCRDPACLMAQNVVVMPAVPSARTVGADPVTAPDRAALRGKPVSTRYYRGGIALTPKA